MNELHTLIKQGKYNLKDEISADAKSLIKGILEVDPWKRLTLKQILTHPWLEDVNDNLQIFTENEINTIKKEFTYNNVWRLNRNLHQQTHTHDSYQAEDKFFTEHPLDSTNNSLMRNATTKSVILAPFNSTKTHISQQFSLEADQFKKGEILKFGIWVWDIDWQYEQNNNCDLDNGVFNEFINKTDSADKGEIV